MSVTVINYSDLTDGTDLTAQIEGAYGTNGAGVIAIRGIPGFVDLKRKFLPKSHTIAHLPSAELDKLVDEKTLFNAGWSHGKEKLGAKPDLAKGSFYFNPLTDAPGTAEDREKYPLSYPVNVWPEDVVVSGFQQEAKELGGLMRDVVVLLSKHIDLFSKKHFPGYVDEYLFNHMKNTEKAKARLLYYYPLSDEERKEGGEDSWIGWHNDSGFLTALAGDMYIDDATGEEVPCPDDKAGLYVTTRSGESVQAVIPNDCMGVQIGECVQIITGGKIVATPHCVRGASVPGIGRIALPVFIDTAPGVELAMPEGCTREQVFESSMLNPKVPELEKRFVEGQTFGDFLKVTFEQYYK